jgi:DNA-binding response OmpR family regulator
MSEEKNYKCKILTVDDELMEDTFFNQFFDMHDYKVLSTLDGKEAVEIVKREKPKVVLLDIRMPGMDGLDVLKQIKKIEPSTVVMMVTALSDAETEKKAKEYGADDYITKPLSLEDLEKKVREIAGA